MKQIIEITEDPNQLLEVITEDNQSFQLKLNYFDQQQSWFASIIFGDFVLNNIRLATSPNILRQYKNIIPFGIAIVTDDFSDPFLITDFSSQRVKLYLLTPLEVEEVETDILS